MSEEPIKFIRISKKILFDSVGFLLKDTSTDEYIVTDLFFNSSGDAVVKIEKNYMDLNILRDYEIIKKEQKD